MAAMSKPLLECRDLVKYFDTPRGKLHAVDHISFTLDAGKTLGIVGESGCGKSTLGRAIIRLIPATSGEVIFEGENILKCGSFKIKELRQKMQIIFQDPFSSLNPSMTVAQTIEEPLKVHRMVPRKERDQRIRELMDMVGLDLRFVNAYPHEMDGGRRQRLGIARALALNPKFIVCDEPVSALDVSIQAQILNLMMDLKEQIGLTYIFITHDLSVVKHISDHIVVMYLGKIVEKAKPQELFDYPLHPYTQALLSAIPVPDASYKDRDPVLIKGEVTSPVNPHPGCRFAARCPLASDICRQQDPEFCEAAPGHFVACHKCTGH